MATETHDAITATAAAIWGRLRLLRNVEDAAAIEQDVFNAVEAAYRSGGVTTRSGFLTRRALTFQPLETVHKTENFMRIWRPGSARRRVNPLVRKNFAITSSARQIAMVTDPSSKCG